MKLSKLALAFFGSALLFSSAVLAGDSNKGSLQLYEKTNVEGKLLNPGHYSITWEGSGADVQVTVREGKQVVATFPAHVTEQANTNSQDAYSTSTAPDGSKLLIAIYPSGKRFFLQVDQNQASR